MYEDYFGLKQAPFSIAPDPRYLFMSERHREALAHLLYGLGGGGGFVLLTGEIGAGKTTVCRCFLEQIPKRCNVAYIFNPKLTVIELVRSVCDEFRIAYPQREPGTATVTDYLDPLNAFLLRTHAIGQNNVLIIDEAQNLSADVLEQLRLMTNLETSERKLLQIVLIGQPELRDMLAQSGLQQLAQRVIARFHLQALSEAETAQYIRHRLTVAGLTGPIPFAADTLRRIHRVCQGVPRRINLLCDRALLGAYASQKAVVDRKVVDQAADEVFGDAGGMTASVDASGGGALLLALVAGLALGAAAYGAAGWWASRSSGRAPASAAAASAGEVFQRSTVAANAAVAASAPPVPAASAVAVSATAAFGNALAAAAPTLLFDATAALERLPRDEREAWAALAEHWQAQLGGGERDACTSAQAQQLPCFRMTTTLAVIRQLDRPGIVTLRDASGKPAYAVLTALGADSAILRFGSQSMSVSLGVLAAMWNGEFATLWRAPADYRVPLSNGGSGPVVEGLSAQLAAWSGEPASSDSRVFDAALKARVSAFQRAQGLKPDGIAGPTTFMQLNRVSGVDEPRLSNVRPIH
ncbi:MAG: AAA family ATPase [Burkholderiales bacterium]